MIDTYKLNNILLKNHNHIITLLEKLDCHGFNFRKNSKSDELRFALPNHKNTTSGCIYLDTLMCSTRTPEYEYSGSLIGFVQFMKNFEFPDTLIWICSKLNIYIEDKSEMFPILNPTVVHGSLGSRIFEAHKKAQQARNKINVQDIDVDLFSINTHQYVFGPHIELIKEGIGAEIQKKFHIGYDIWSKRILFPHRYWDYNKNPNGDFVGIIGRTTNPFWEELEIPKYFPLKSYSKRINLYGLWENYQERKPTNLSEKQNAIYKTMQDSHYIVVYESEKSVLKRATWNDFTGVALGGHELQKEQIKILNSLSNVHEIIFAFDKDIPESKVKETCSLIKGKKTSYIIDKENLLGDKDSPADASQFVFWKLFGKRIKV